VPDVTEGVPTWRKNVVVSALLVSILAILWVSAFDPITGLAPDRDSGIFLYVGQQLLHGQTLYRDLFDNKGPLVYVVNALGLAVGGGSLWGVYVLGIVLLCGAVVLTYLGFQRRFGFRAGAAAALYCALLLGVFVPGNMPEGYVWLTQLAALFLLTWWRPDEARVFPYVLLGVTGAAAFFLKTTGIGLWLSLVVAESLFAVKSSDWRLYRRHMASLAAGAGLGAVACLAFLAVTGALTGFLRVYFAFNAAYASQHGFGDRLSSLVEGIQLVGYLPAACLAGVWLLMLARIVVMWRRGDTPGLVMLLAVVWLPVEFILASLAGRGGRYFNASLPALVLLFALACREIAPAESEARSSAGRAARLRVSLLVMLAIGAVVGLTPALLQSARNLGGAVVHHSDYALIKPNAVYPGSCYPQVVDYVRKNTGAGDYVLVWGDYSQATNFLADRRTPTRFVFQPFLYEATFGDAFVREFLNDLRAHPPVLIVDTSPSSAAYVERPSIASVESTWPAGRSDFEVAWRQVGAYLSSHYRPAETLPYDPYWKVYVRS